MKFAPIILALLLPLNALAVTVSSSGGLQSTDVDTSAELAAIVTDETGSGVAVFATSPTLTTPLLGTPTSGTLTNCTGLPAAGVVGTAATLGANTFSGHQLYSATNTYDIGSDTSMPRDLWVGRDAWVRSTGGGANAVAYASSGNGILWLKNWNGNDFNRVQFGGTTASFPSIKRSGTVLQARLADDSNPASFSGRQNYVAAAELTIATGAITTTASYHKVDAEADAASDDLDTISGGAAGDVLILRAENDARSVVVKDGTGNIQCAGDCTLDNVQDSISLIFDGSAWLETARSNNGT